MSICNQLKELVKAYPAQEISRQHFPNDGSDFDEICHTILGVEEQNLPQLLQMFLVEPVCAFSASATTWFVLGLMYCHQYGIPADVARLFPAKETNERL